MGPKCLNSESNGRSILKIYLHLHLLSVIRESLLFSVFYFFNKWELTCAILCVFWWIFSRMTHRYLQIIWIICCIIIFSLLCVFPPLAITQHHTLLLASWSSFRASAQVWDRFQAPSDWLQLPKVGLVAILGQSLVFPLQPSLSGKFRNKFYKWKFQLLLPRVTRIIRF